MDADQTGRAALGSTTEQNGALGLYSDTTSGTTTYFTRLPSGTNQAIGETVGTSNYYYLTDLRGSVVGVSNSTGTVSNSYTYDPYGQTLSSSGTVSNPYGFQGGYKDASTGLYKYGERYYNPTYVTWTQLDPSGQNAGYLFAGDDPVNQEDPSGTAYAGYNASGCLFLCLNFGLSSDDVSGGAHFSVGLGIGLDIGYSAGAEVGKGSVNSGLSGGGACAAGYFQGGYSGGSTGNGLFGGVNVIPAELGCQAQGAYTF